MTAEGSTPVGGTTPEERAEMRERAIFWTTRHPSAVGRLYDRHAVAFAEEVLALLDALDRVEALAICTRGRDGGECGDCRTLGGHGVSAKTIRAALRGDG